MFKALFKKIEKFSFKTIYSKRFHDAKNLNAISNENTILDKTSNNENKNSTSYLNDTKSNSPTDLNYKDKNIKIEKISNGSQSSSNQSVKNVLKDNFDDILKSYIMKEQENSILIKPKLDNHSSKKFNYSNNLNSGLIFNDHQQKNENIKVPNPILLKPQTIKNILKEEAFSEADINLFDDPIVTIKENNIKETTTAQQEKIIPLINNNSKSSTFAKQKISPAQDNEKKEEESTHKIKSILNTISKEPSEKENVTSQQEKIIPIINNSKKNTFISLKTSPPRENYIKPKEQYTNKIKSILNKVSEEIPDDGDYIQDEYFEDDNKPTGKNKIEYLKSNDFNLNKVNLFKKSPNVSNTTITQKPQKITPSETYNKSRSVQQTPKNDILGNEIFKNMYSYYKDENYCLKKLFETMNCKIIMKHYEELIKEIRENKLNMIDLTIYISYIQMRIIDPTSFTRLVNINFNLISNKYSLMLMDYIIEHDEILFTNIDFVIELSEFYFSKLKLKNYKLLNFLENYLTENAYDFPPKYLVSILRCFNQVQWKINDEDFGDLISRITAMNLAKFNYNAYALFIVDVSDFKKTHLYMYKIFEELVILKFKNLYKSKSIERLSEGFIKTGLLFPGNFQTIYELAINYLKSIHPLKVTYGEIKTLSNFYLCNLPVRDYIIKHLKDTVKNREYLRFDEFEGVAYLYMALYKINNSEHDMPFLNKINSSFKLQMINNKEIIKYLEGLHTIGYLNFFNFKAQDISFCENFKKLDGSFYANINMLHNLSLYDERVLYLIDHFVKEVSFDELFFALGSYLRLKKENSDLKFYQIILEYFKNVLSDKNMNDVEILKSKILSLPLYHNVLTEKEINTFVKDNEIDLINLTEWSKSDNTPEMKLLKIIYHSSIHKRDGKIDKNLIINLKEAHLLTKIKECSMLSKDEMKNLYQFEGYNIRFC